MSDLARRAVTGLQLLSLGSLAIVAFLLLALTRIPWPGFAAAGAALALAAYRNVRGDLGKAVGARILVTCGAVVHAFRAGGGDLDVPLLVAALLAIGLVMHEDLVAGMVDRGYVAVGQLPGFRTRTEPVFPPQLLYFADLALVAVVTAFALLTLPSWPLVAVGGLVTVGAAALLLDAHTLARGRGRAWGKLRAALHGYAPTFAVHFSGPPEALHQIGMWLPHLDRVGRPYVIIVRERDLLAPVLGMTSAPVVECPTIASLDNVVVPSLRAAFYVNNGMKNTHLVRYTRLTHVQLLHGDSDKPPSHNPVTAMYDRVFVAGQAAIDRYHRHGVAIPDEKFDIVGRPQVAAIEVADKHVGEVTDKVVLYAPTWKGYSEDLNYCSLPVARKLVAALLEQGATVILRPHPFTSTDRESVRRIAELERMLAEDTRVTGRRHRFGRAATHELSIVDSFNLAHAMVADVSGVVSDFLYSQKPFAITDMTGSGEEFASTFPLASAGYVLRRTMRNLDKVLDELLETDPLEPVRRDVRTYYLGDFPVGRYADAFVTAARRYV